MEMWRAAVVVLAAALAGCGLPANTSTADWARGAGVAVVRPLAGLAAEPARDDAIQAMQQALANHFFALALLSDEGRFAFDGQEFEGLARRAAVLDGGAGADIAALAVPLAVAAGDPYPLWLPSGSASPQAQLNDRRPPRLLLAADPAVQRLLTAIARPLQAPPPAAAAPDAAPNALVERQAARQAADRAAQIEVLRRIAAGHALLASHVPTLSHRETEMLVRTEMLRLRQAIAAMPPASQPPAAGQAIASVLPP